MRTILPDGTILLDAAGAKEEVEAYQAMIAKRVPASAPLPPETKLAAKICAWAKGLFSKQPIDAITFLENHDLLFWVDEPDIAGGESAPGNDNDDLEEMLEKRELWERDICLDQKSRSGDIEYPRNAPNSIFTVLGLVEQGLRLVDSTEALVAIGTRQARQAPKSSP